MGGIDWSPILLFIAIYLIREFLGLILVRIGMGGRP
jgi:uncharacterized protein YggT (Ycf19 family)